jgi:hypothetical protein
MLGREVDDGLSRENALMRELKQFQVKETLEICGVVEAIRHVFGVSLR